MRAHRVVDVLADRRASRTGPATRDDPHRVALVIEDDKQAAYLAKMLLEEEGFRVLLAPSAESALVMVQQNTRDLITLDLQLPGMSGMDFLLTLGRDPRMSNVPVVIVSGHTDGTLGLPGGAAAVLQKPISRARLQESLAGLDLGEAADRTHTVLVVDDDQRAVPVLGQWFEGFGCHADTLAVPGR